MDNIRVALFFNIVLSYARLETIPKQFRLVSYEEFWVSSRFLSLENETLVGIKITTYLLKEKNRMENWLLGGGLSLEYVAFTFMSITLGNILFYPCGVCTYVSFSSPALYSHCKFLIVTRCGYVFAQHF